jgi:hypothetical protein
MVIGCPFGAHTESTLREEVNGAAVVVGLVTPNSLASAYVAFELGARWGAGSFVAPLLAGVLPQDLEAPLSYLNVVRASHAGQLHQFVAELSACLEKTLESAASYQYAIDRVAEIAMQIKGSPVNEAQEEINRLQAEIERLKIKPYEDQKLQRVQAILNKLGYLERGALRLFALNGETPGYVIDSLRSDKSALFDFNELHHTLLRTGLMTRTEETPIGHPTFNLNPNVRDVLQDLLFPRREKRAPYFVGL